MPVSLIVNTPSKLTRMKIFGWAADNAGCQFYRIKMPLDSLKVDLGHEASYGQKLIEECLRDESYTIIGQRVCNPAPASLWKGFAKRGRKLIYEIDDDLFNVDPSSSAYAFFNQKGIRQNLRDCASVASRVIVSTEPLAEIMRQFNDDVVVCPNAIPAWLLDEDPLRHNNEKITIGWGGSPTHNMDFDIVGGHIRRVIDQNPITEFHAIGTDYAAKMRIPHGRSRFTPWIPDVPSFFRAIDYHIGIAPLKNHVFNRSKSHIKALECAALGIPIIASDVEPYRNFVVHGVTGFLVRSDHEWGSYLRDLINDSDMRIAMGKEARKFAERHTIESQIEMWERAYEIN